MFGMLILVFVLFFGMPSMGVTQGASIFNRPSKVFDTDVTLNEARSYAQRFLRSRKDKEVLNNMRMRFRQIQDVVMLDVTAKRLMGWESLAAEEEAYMVSDSNFDHVFFGSADITQADLHKAFIDHIEKNGEKLEQLSARELLSRFMDFSRKARGFSTKNMNDWLDSWGIDGQEYLEIKAREMRVRGYLDFLQSQVKASKANAQDQVEQRGMKWTFDYALIGADNIKVSDQVNDEDGQAYIKTHEKIIADYYNRNIKDYSKSKFAFSRLSINYNSVAEAQQAKEKLNAARKMLKEGVEQDQVIKTLSQAGLKIQVLEQGNKSRANMKAELYTTALAMDVNQVSEIQGLDKTPTDASKNQQGSYYVIKLKTKEVGEEKKLKDAKLEIAKILIVKDKQRDQMKPVANEIHAQVKSGVALSAAIDAYNAQLSDQEAAQPVTLSESGEVTLAGLANNRVGNIGRYAVTADQLLSEIIHINDQNRVPSVLTVGTQRAILVLKERSQAGDDHEKLTEQEYPMTLQQARAEFFGRSWISFILTGDQNSSLISVLPIQILIKLQQEMLSATSGDGLIDQLLNSKDYRDRVTEDKIVMDYLSGKGS
jgi:hypothetical protein